MIGNTDMAHYWHYLGFVRRVPGYGKIIGVDDDSAEDSIGEFPIFVEKERGTFLRQIEGVQSGKTESRAASSSLKFDGISLKFNFDDQLPPPQRFEALLTEGEEQQQVTGMWSLKRILHKLLQAAMEIELSTIPIYLFAMYSIKPPPEAADDPHFHDPVVGAIRGASSTPRYS